MQIRGNQALSTLRWRRLHPLISARCFSRCIIAIFIFIVLIYLLVPRSSYNVSHWKEAPKRTRQVARLVNPHDFHLMINNPKICPKETEMMLLIMVTSAPSNFYRRRAIRETWGGPTHLTSLASHVMFLLGDTNDTSLYPKIVEESRSYGDILQESFLDSYMNLTLKTVMGLKWVTKYCPKAKFIMKTDDDIFVNVPLLINYLKDVKERRFITGCIKQKKSFQPVNVPADMHLPMGHPPFAAGAGYVMSGNIVESLFRASLMHKIIPIEDVYVTAHLAGAIGVHPPKHHDSFTCGEMVMDDCELAQKFTGHRITPERMYQIWDKLDPKGVNSLCYDF